MDKPQATNSESPEALRSCMTASLRGEVKLRFTTSVTIAIPTLVAEIQRANLSIEQLAELRCALNDEVIRRVSSLGVSAQVQQHVSDKIDQGDVALGKPQDNTRDESAVPAGRIGRWEDSVVAAGEGIQHREHQADPLAIEEDGDFPVPLSQ